MAKINIKNLKTKNQSFKKEPLYKTEATLASSNKDFEEIEISETQDLLQIDEAEKTIKRTFGRPEDVIEIHIYNLDDTLISSIYNFTDYTFPEGQETSSELIIDFEKALNEAGFVSGKYKVKLNLHRNKVFNTEEYPFFLKEISPSRTELKITTPDIPNKTLDSAVNSFISELGSSSYFKEFALNFSSDVIIPCVNILLNKEPISHEILIKTLDPLPSNVLKNETFKIIEEITDGTFIEIDLGEPEVEDDSIELLGPNFKIDTRLNNSKPSAYQNYDELLKYSITSSYDRLLNKLENHEIPNIEYDFIRAVSSSRESTDITYHFESFVHFSSAEERLKNFHYKLKLISTYDEGIKDYNNVPGNASASLSVLQGKEELATKKRNLIKGFDGYEQFLYNETGSNVFTWPKQDSNNTPVPWSSSVGLAWLGNSDSAFDNYGGQLLSASLYDNQNSHNLNRFIPQHIADNPSNALYISFVNMIGQHFDYIWTYIKHISELNNHHNKRGISKDLVYLQLKSLGLETFDQFENANLVEYILGEGYNGSKTYDVNHYFNWAPNVDPTGNGSASLDNEDLGRAASGSETLVTASIDGSIPKGDITREIWKRLYHNAPYLLKTKGTERGLRALMACYGVPSTILNVKEYGGSTSVTGPLKDIDFADYYKTFTYDKNSLAKAGDSGTTTGFFVKTEWSSSVADDQFTAAQQRKKTVGFRIKPYRLESNQHLFTLSGSTYDGKYTASNDQSLIIVPHTGNDISSSGDASQYGKLQYHSNGNVVVSTVNFPIFNGDFWNIYINASRGIDASGAESDHTSSIDFGAYQANFNRNILSTTTSSIVTNGAIKNIHPSSWGEGKHGAKNVYIGGLPSNVSNKFDNLDELRYSGSLQELRYYFGENLNTSTLKKQALEPFMYGGNSVSSSYDHLVFRSALGSNDKKEDASSHHPNQNVAFLPPASSSLSTLYEGIGWEEIVEQHYLPTPDTVGASTTSEKVRTDSGSIDDDALVHNKSLETSTLDRQPPEYEDLGIFFSPTEEINEDIIYTLGSFRMDDFIGSPLPSAQTASRYEDLKDIRDIYTKKLSKGYNYGDYIKLIQQIDHTLFKIIEQWVPFKANTKTGLLIEPTYLERSKFERTLPERSDGQTMTEGLHQHIHTQISTSYGGESNLIANIADTGVPNTPEGEYEPGTYVVANNNLSFATSSKGERLEQGSNGTIEIYDDHLDPTNKDPNRENQQACQAPIVPFQDEKPFGYKSHISSTLLGNATKGRLSRRYYRYREFNPVTSSLYL